MDGNSRKFGLHDSIGFFTTRAARLIERRVEEDLRTHGLTRMGWCILLAVTEEGLKFPSEIAAFIGIDRTAASRVLRTLEADGLVERKIGQADRRMTEVQVTPLGRARMQEAQPICQENMSHFDTKLDPAELAELKRLLVKICADEQDMIGN